MAGNTVTGDRYISIDGKLSEIKAQMRRGLQIGGYAFDPRRLDEALQHLVEGRFAGPDPKPDLVITSFGAVPAFENFGVKDVFGKAGKKPQIGPIKVGVDDRFRKFFYGVENLSAPAGGILVRKLRNYFRESSVIDTLGENYKTSLGHVWSMLQAQFDGRKGLLASKGNNILYVDDVESVTRAISVYGRWCGENMAQFDGWTVDAMKLNHLHHLETGTHILTPLLRSDVS